MHYGRCRFCYGDWKRFIDMYAAVKKVLQFSIALATAVILSTAWWLIFPRAAGPASVYVETGTPFYKVVGQLKSKDVISAPWLFSKVAILIGLDTRIIPGRYDFDQGVSNLRVLQKLWRGDIVYAVVRIPEGASLRRIGELMYELCGTPVADFDAATRDTVRLAKLGIHAAFAEGYLFPETYRFEWGISAARAADLMIRQLFTRITPRILARCDTLGYSLHDLLIMASIVEREALVSDEFPVIASVYYNRYRKGMKLQADPTVIYGMGGTYRKLLYRDYRFPSEYNTYLHGGLPPTPICSPGMDAIQAALYPDSTEYYFFVADGSGRHVFSKTYQQHLAAIRRIRQGSK